MYIPVRLAQGATSATVLVNVTGTLVAQCQAVYEGTTYDPGVSIAVVKGKSIQFKTTVTAYAEISVVLDGKQFYWFVDLPKTLRYANDLAYKRITGSTYGKLNHYPGGASVAFADTGSFAASDAVAAVDFVKKDVWFFNAANQVKKLSVATAPIAVVFAPRWALTDGVTTVAYIIADTKIIRLTSSFAVDVSFDVEAGCKAASGDVNGNIVLAYDTKLVVWNPSTGLVIETVSVDQGFVALHNIFVLPDNSYVTAGDAGLKMSVKTNGVWTSTVLLPIPGRYQSLDMSSTHLYAADGFNRCVRAIALADWSYTTEYYDFVPRSVAVKDTKVTVGFYNSTTSYQYALDLTGKTALTTVKTFGAAYLTDYVVTDLYSDAVDTTVLEPDVAPLLVTPNDFPISADMHYEWTCPWVRPDFVRVGSSAGTVKVNGNSFTSGYLKKGDLVSIDLPATESYYNDRWVSLIGRQSVSFQFRSEPRLFPDLVTLPRVLNAIPRIAYDFSYVVTGITDDFSVNISAEANESEVSFSVNEGEYGFRGVIKTGDTVHVRAVIKNLLARQTPHVVTTDIGKKAVHTLTVLPMILNGVEIRRDSIDKVPRFAQRMPSNKPTVLPRGTPEIIAPPVSLHTTRAGEQGNTAASITLAPAGIEFQRQRGTESLHARRESMIVKVTSTLHNARTHERHVAHDEVQAAKTPEKDVTRLVEHQCSAPERDVTRLIAHTLDKPERLTPVFLDAGMPTSEWTSVTQTFHAGREGDVYPAPLTFKGDTQWFKRINISRMWSPEIPTEWILLSLGAPFYFTTTNVRHQGVHVASTNAAFDFQLFGKPLFANAEFRPQTLAHIELFTTGHARRPASTVERWDAESVLRPQQTRELSPISFDRRTPWHLEELDLVYMWRRNSSTLIDAQYERARWSSRYIPAVYSSNQLEHRTVAAEYQYVNEVGPRAFDSVGQVAKPATRTAHALAHAVRKTNIMLVDRPATTAVVQTRDFVLPELSSGFGTREQAEAYALELELSSVVFTQINGKWVFVTLPDADTAPCGVVIEPPAKQKIFGYLGGG